MKAEKPAECEEAEKPAECEEGSPAAAEVVPEGSPAAAEEVPEAMPDLAMAPSMHPPLGTMQNEAVQSVFVSEPNDTPLDPNFVAKDGPASAVADTFGSPFAPKDPTHEDSSPPSVQTSQDSPFTPTTPAN